MRFSSASKLLAAIAALLFVGTAHAGITLVGAPALPVLTLLNQASGFASGSVGVDVRNREFLSGNVALDGAETGVRTLGELGLSGADSLRLTVAVDGAGSNAPLRLENLVLSIWDPSGILLFSSGQFSPVTLGPIGQPMGWSFALDSGSAALAQRTAFSGAYAGNRVGLFASVSDVNAGVERFYMSGTLTPAPVPEPSTFGLCLAGLLMLGLLARRRGY
jgi:hypothetical protein